MELTWLGQGGFLFESGGVKVAVDPYLSDALAGRGTPRMFPAPVAPDKLKVDWLICTHDHLDHLDPETAGPMAKAFPDMRITGPKSVVKHLREMGVAPARCVELKIGKAQVCGAIKIIPVKAIHSDPEAVGLLLEADGIRVYLSADTEYADDLAEKVLALAEGKIDLALICINGRLGNMNDTDAVKVIKKLAPVEAAPMHYGLFERNTADPQPFLQAVRAAGIRARELTVSERFTVGGDK
jgi:L-ascorbate metabolism protein UlaG (beta-lactamase superfamily)